MASLVYNSAIDDALRGNILFATDTFKGMLVTSTYVENKDTHLKRSDVTNEVTGTGYTAGGVAVAVTMAKDTTNDRIRVTLGAISIPTATITARKLVVYKSRGGANTADELVAVNDFGSDITSTNGTFAVAATTLDFTNP